MTPFHLQIVTPDRTAFDGMAQKVLVRTVTGDACILAKHIDYAAPLAIGEAHITDENGNVRAAAVNSGLLTVSGGEVRILSTTFEWEDEIDKARAEESREQAAARLRELDRADAEFAIMEAKLKRAMVRIGAASNR